MTARWLTVEAARVGAPAGVLFGLMQFGLSGRTGPAIAGGVFFAVLFGIGMAVFIQRSWPGGALLNPKDRASVVRAVRRGGRIPEPRLARPASEYAGVIARTSARDARNSWVMWVGLLAAALFAITASAQGHVRQAVVWSVLVAWWVVMVGTAPRLRARRLARAEAVAAKARRELGE